MTKQTLLQRVAKAIESAELRWKAENGGDLVSCLDCPDEVKARAAIEAMREPTDAMVEAGDAGIDGDCRMECSASRCYQAMIDAALNKHGESQK